MESVIQSVYEAHFGPFRFCPVCGKPLERKCLKVNEPARLVCTVCSFVLYQDPKLVACTILRKGGRIALLRRAIQPEKGKWVMPGGYVDRGEKAEAAAVRETLEECGLKSRIERLFGVYSYEGQPNVVLVFIASPVDGDFHPDDETSEVGWFSREEIPWGDLAFQSTVDALHDFFADRGTA
ncbi:NUDIX hydrolase [Desulfatiglans anilini]|uniref:NUDIX hydrolase n=1 Tax=Desulfatiglans anilini TaxID=90728 RepID=UPI0003FD3EA7|nr:NUDIX hydrolase [Desulfatiglans anilini]